jgi:hypothetical protein
VSGRVLLAAGDVLCAVVVCAVCGYAVCVVVCCALCSLYLVIHG